MTPNLVSHFVQCGTSTKVRDVVKSYLDASCTSHVYESMKKILNLCYGGRFLT